METSIQPYCPECTDVPELNDIVTRRAFIARTGAVLVGAAVAAAVPSRLLAAPRAALRVAAPESLVKTLHASLSSSQKAAVLKQWDDPLRLKVGANWAIVDPTVEKTFTPDQQEMIHGILRGVTNEEWYPKFLAQMKQDGGGFEQYHVALFEDPRAGKVEYVMTGRHMTMRCGGDPRDNMAFGGPIFYGHAVKFNEDAGHPGNLFWYQGAQANEVFGMLDAKQRDQALIALAPAEDAISFRRPGEPLPGVRVGDMTADQKNHVHSVMHDMLAPYRPQDVKQVLADLKDSGGLDDLHMAFYKQDHLGNGTVWDIWRMEGPDFVWHFRGAPHVHTWVHIGTKGAERKVIV